MFKPRERIVTKVIWDGEDRVEIQSDGGTWYGAKRKDFWNPDDKWEERIKIGSLLRFWTIQWSIILGFELFEDNKWVSVWCHANDFQTKEEREKSNNAYVNFTQEEGNKIAVWIDEGENLQQIDKLISDEHTGNTYGWALNIGINTAKNKDNAEKVRQEHNKKYNIPPDKKGVVNPAILTIKT